VNDSRSVPDGRITEDAPEGHPVWRVRIHPDNSNGSWNARFPDGENGKLKKFSVARAAEEDARKILRICGAQLIDGRPREDVEQLRMLLCNRCTGKDEADTFDICANWAKTAAECGEPLAMPKQQFEFAPAAPKAAAGTTTVAAAGGQAGPGVTSKSTPASQAAPEANPPPTGDELEDAPPDSAAHQKVRFDQKKGAYTFTTPDASKKHFQTTVHAAAKNVEAAGRIARVCFCKFEQGVSMEEVMQYRNEAYKRLGGAPKVPASNGTTAVEKPAPPPRKRPKSTDAEEATIERLQQQGKLLHALEISGRDSNKKNSTVNGVYMAVEGGYKGHQAYERIGKKGDEARRCLFYSKEKSRWKISEGLGDHKNFAFLKVKDGGTKPPSAAGSKIHWHFFDGKDVGWTEDREVKCVPYEQGKRAKTENGDAPEIAVDEGSVPDSATLVLLAFLDRSDAPRPAPAAGVKVAKRRELDKSRAQSEPSLGFQASDDEGAGPRQADWQKKMLYDFLPPPDPVKDEAAKAAAVKNHLSRPALPPAEKSRVIFLDVDGVILPAGSIDMIVVDGVTLPAKSHVKESDFSAQAMGSLRAIVQQTGATIVLSSEWRRGEDLKSSINAVLKSQDIPYIRDSTPIFHPRPEIQKVNAIYAWCERRAREIGKWLKDHPEVTAWVALDDLDFDWADSLRQAGTPWMKVRSVHTNDRICLTDADAAEAVRILLNPPADPKVPQRPISLQVPSGPSGVLASTEDSGPDRIRLG
ncbi:GOR, partial [Symbiodinium sp. KB8]